MSNQERAGPSIPSIKPAQDQVDSRRHSGRPGVPRQSKFNGLLVFVIVLMVAIMAVGGYTLFELQKELARSNELLSQSQSSISELDARLAATGTDVSRTMEDLESQVSTNFSEIDKLWSLAHRKNLPDIQKNAHDLEKLQVNLDGKISSLDTNMKSLSAQVDITLNEMREIKQQFDSGDEGVIEQVTRLRNHVQEQAVVQEANKRNMAVLNNRLKEIDEAITAIDQHRVQVNKQLLELKGRQESQDPVNPQEGADLVPQTEIILPSPE